LAPGSERIGEWETLSVIKSDSCRVGRANRDDLVGLASLVCDPLRSTLPTLQDNQTSLLIAPFMKSNKISLLGKSQNTAQSIRSLPGAKVLLVESNQSASDHS